MPGLGTVLHVLREVRSFALCAMPSLLAPAVPAWKRDLSRNITASADGVAVFVIGSFEGAREAAGAPKAAFARGVHGGKIE